MYQLILVIETYSKYRIREIGPLCDNKGREEGIKHDNETFILSITEPVLPRVLYLFHTRPDIPRFIGDGSLVFQHIEIGSCENYRTQFVSEILDAVIIGEG